MDAIQSEHGNPEESAGQEGRPSAQKARLIPRRGRRAWRPCSVASLLHRYPKSELIEFICSSFPISYEEARERLRFIQLHRRYVRLRRRSDSLLERMRSIPSTGEVRARLDAAHRYLLLSREWDQVQKHMEACEEALVRFPKC